MLNLELWPIDRLKPYERNPRKNDKAVDPMCGSIREFGFAVPMLARSDGEVVDGHLRLKAARKLGSWPGGDISGIPVVVCDGWTPAQVKAFRLMVNRSVAWADWDLEALGAEFLELKALYRSPVSTSARLTASRCNRTLPRMTYRPCRKLRYRSLATCGKWAITGCCAGTPRRRMMWRG